MNEPRKILLIEPKYKNKYPPIGLMKIATYHRILGDEVKFYKGDLKELVLDQLTEECINKLLKIDLNISWRSFFKQIRNYIKYKKAVYLEEIDVEKSEYHFLVYNCLLNFSDIYRRKDYKNFPKWDRVYVTTLFTFYWKVTVETIHYAKLLVNNPDQIMVGGVLASLLHEELEKETGIRSQKGLLDKPGMLDPNIAEAKDLIVDNLPLDYSILEEIDYQYPTGSAYFTFMTKGCTRKCAFCSVPILEPTYKDKIDTIDKFQDIKGRYGEQQHLLLMDNNVLASPKFPEIIQEIKHMGFIKGATYVEPNQLEIAVNNLRENFNEKAYLKRTHRLLNNLTDRLKGKPEIQQVYYNSLERNGLIKFETVTKGGVLNAYSEVKDIYEKYRSKVPKKRYVDFNQGTDARYVTEELMRLMSEIPIRPLRIAFDYWGMKDKYENAVRLAAKYKITELSNYILYNFKDSPEELYKRLEINVRLNEDLGIHIYSFPMKYIPLFGEEAKDRNFVGSKWNRKFIRAVQSILNVTKGIVAPGRSFFIKAFGKNLDEFQEILHMPEDYIVYRYFFESNGQTESWRTIYHSLNSEEREIACKIIRDNNFTTYYEKTDNDKIMSLLQHYRIRRENYIDLDQKDYNYQEIKKQFDKLVKEEPFIDLTLTYDFEDEVMAKS